LSQLIEWLGPLSCLLSLLANRSAISRFSPPGMNPDRIPGRVHCASLPQGNSARPSSYRGAPPKIIISTAAAAAAATIIVMLAGEVLRAEEVNLEDGLRWARAAPGHCLECVDNFVAHSLACRAGDDGDREVAASETGKGRQRRRRPISLRLGGGGSRLVALLLWPRAGWRPPDEVDEYAVHNDSILAGRVVFSLGKPPSDKSSDSAHKLAGWSETGPNWRPATARRGATDASRTGTGATKQPTKSISGRQWSPLGFHFFGARLQHQQLSIRCRPAAALMILTRGHRN
jgi:hypothetical protein